MSDGYNNSNSNNNDVGQRRSSSSNNNADDFYTAAAAMQLSRSWAVFVGLPLYIEDGDRYRDPGCFGASFPLKSPLFRGCAAKQ